MMGPCFKNQKLHPLSLFIALILFSCGLPDTVVLDPPEITSDSSFEIGFQSPGSGNVTSYILYYKIYAQTEIGSDVVNEDKEAFIQSNYVGSQIPLERGFNILRFMDPNEAESNTNPEILDKIIYSGTDEILLLNPSVQSTPPHLRMALPTMSSSDEYYYLLRNLSGVYVSDWEDLSFFEEYSSTDSDLIDLYSRYNGDISSLSSFTVAIVGYARGTNPANLTVIESLPIWLGTIDYFK